MKIIPSLVDFLNTVNNILLFIFNLLVGLQLVLGIYLISSVRLTLVVSKRSRLSLQVRDEAT